MDATLSSVVRSQTPRSWSLLTHHRAAHHPRFQGAGHTSGAFASCTPTAIFSPAASDGGDSGSLPAGGVLPSICSSPHVDSEEVLPPSPTVSTASFVCGSPAPPPVFRPSAASSQSGASAGGGRHSAFCSAAAANDEEDVRVSKTPTQLKSHPSLFGEGEAVRAAWRTFAQLLYKVRELHLSRCPLCSPPRPPNWWSKVRGEKRRRDDPNSALTVEGHNAKKSGQGEESGNHSICLVSASPSICIETKEMTEEEKQLEVFVDEECSASSLMSLQQRVRTEAVEFLERVYERREYLSATSPVMYQVCPETHVLRLKCAELGGIVMIEALLLGL